MSRIHAVAHPNIALIKYWGKKPFSHDTDRNMGVNPSVSMTLSQAQTDVILSKSQSGNFEIIIEGQPASSHDFEKLTQHAERIAQFFGMALTPLKIESKNNFPKGTGIASSASAFAALTYGITAQLLGFEEYKKQQVRITNDLSRLARRGSGSAARSVAGGFMKWEQDFAESCHNSWQLKDTIVIFSKLAKKVSSTDGHKRVESSPLWSARQSGILNRYHACLKALEQKDLALLGPIIEEEATEMHLVAESSQPPIQYRSPETLAFLDEMQKMKSRDFYFTLDAGPNIHLISERAIVSEVQALLQKCGIQAEIWQDWTGSAPVVKEIP